MSRAPADEVFALRDLRHRDIERVLEIERECFTTPWPASAFGLAVATPEVLFLGALDGEALVGYAVAAPTGREGVLIANLAVAPDRRRKGAATTLIEAILDWSRMRGATFCRLDVRRSNDSAIELYRRFGFRTDGIQRNYYSHPQEDALSMSRRL